jgi:hypothetical protein
MFHPAGVLCAIRLCVATCVAACVAGCRPDHSEGGPLSPQKCGEHQRSHPRHSLARQRHRGLNAVSYPRCFICECPFESGEQPEEVWYGEGRILMLCPGCVSPSPRDLAPAGDDQILTSVRPLKSVHWLARGVGARVTARLLRERSREMRAETRQLLARSRELIGRCWIELETAPRLPLQPVSKSGR